MLLGLGIVRLLESSPSLTRRRRVAPIFAVDSSTPPMGYVINKDKSAPNWDKLQERYGYLFNADLAAPGATAELRSKFPVTIPKIMSAPAVVKPNFDPKGRTRASARRAARVASGVTEDEPRPCLDDDAVVVEVERPRPKPKTKQGPRHEYSLIRLVWTVNGRRARLLTVVRRLTLPTDRPAQADVEALLLENGFSAVTTITGATAYVAPDGIAYESIEAAATALGVPRTIGGFYIVLAVHSLLPRTDDINLLPPTDQDIVRESVERAVARVAKHGTDGCVFCGGWPHDVAGGFIP